MNKEKAKQDFIEAILKSAKEKAVNTFEGTRHREHFSFVINVDDEPWQLDMDLSVKMSVDWENTDYRICKPDDADISDSERAEMEFRRAAKPLMMWMREHGHPHSRIFLDGNHAVFTEGAIAFELED